MTFRFDSTQGLVIAMAELTGPSGSAIVRLALDTGATGTLINTAIMVSVGYDPGVSPDRVQVTTGSGVEFVPRVKLEKIEALGRERTDFPVLCHTLPASASVDGLLGLDFFRGLKLNIDFSGACITLA